MWETTLYDTVYIYMICTAKLVGKLPFLLTTAVPADTARARITYGNYVRLSVRLTRPGTDSRPGQIENPGFHRMIVSSFL